MNEFLSALICVWCSITYWMGGQELPFIRKGYKWIRRFLMPASLFIGLLFIGAVWWKAATACALLSAATHIGYQNKLWKYAMTGLFMGLPAIIFTFPRFEPVMLFPCLFHTVFGDLSLKYNRFSWASVALLTGLSIGIAYTVAVQK